MKLVHRKGALRGEVLRLPTSEGQKAAARAGSGDSVPTGPCHSTVHSLSCHPAAGSYEGPFETGTTGKPCRIIYKPTSNNIVRSPKGMRKRSNLKSTAKTICSLMWAGNGSLTG